MDIFLAVLVSPETIKETGSPWIATVSECRDKDEGLPLAGLGVLFLFGFRLLCLMWEGDRFTAAGILGVEVLCWYWRKDWAQKVEGLRCSPRKEVEEGGLEVWRLTEVLW